MPTKAIKNKGKKKKSLNRDNDDKPSTTSSDAKIASPTTARRGRGDKNKSSKNTRRGGGDNVTPRSLSPLHAGELEDMSQLKGVEAMKVPELKSLLKQKGLPMMGCRSELIERLNKYPNGDPKPKKWQHSSAKKDLKRQLLDPQSPIHNMSIAEIWKSDARYKQYPNFPKYYNDLKKHVVAAKERARLDDIAVERHIRNNPRSHLNKRGYPHWNLHAAKKFLEEDVANELNKTMKPSELQKTRDAYMDFPAKVFMKRVNREAEKQRAALFWAHKRNKRGMKLYLQDIAERT